MVAFFSLPLLLSEHVIYDFYARDSAKHCISGSHSPFGQHGKVVTISLQKESAIQASKFTWPGGARLRILALRKSMETVITGFYR